MAGSKSLPRKPRERTAQRARLSLCLAATLVLAGCGELSEVPVIGKLVPGEEGAAQGLRYDVTISGAPSPRIEDLLRRSALLVSLRDRPPPGLAALRRRAESDQERLLDVMHSEGFYDAAVSWRIEGSGRRHTVAVTVTPGIPYLLSDFAIDYTRPPREPARAGLDALGIDIGMIARATDIVAAERKLTAHLAAHGYPKAEIVRRRNVLDRKLTTLAVNVTVDPGPFARFDGVSVKGLTTVARDYASGLAALPAGNPFDVGKVEAARRALAETGLFESVVTEPLGKVGDDGTLPVAFAVKERAHRSVGFGAGYSTSEGGRGNVFWEHRNLLGRGETLNLGLTAAEIEQSLNATFRKPAFLRRDQVLLGEAHLANRITDAFDERSLVGSLGIERPLGKRWRGTAAVSAELSRQKDDQGTTFFQLFGLPLTARRDSTDDLLDPTRGMRLDLTLTPYIGHGETPLLFAVGGAIGSAYVALDDAKRVVLAGRARLATIAGSRTEIIPANKRLYAGGGGSIRGYKFQSVGPLDAQGDPLGGRSAVEFGGELRVRVGESFGVVPFLDGGTVFDQPYFGLDQTIRWAAGLGLRYYSPVGPLRLDLAFPINRRERDDAFQFYVSIGQAF